MKTSNNGWHFTFLNNIVGETGLMIDGDWVESKDQDPKGAIRLIQLADVGDGKYLNVSKRFLTKEKAEELKCTYLHQGDVLIARMPDPLGRACIFPGDEKTCVTVVDVCIVRADKSIADNKFLMYKINTSEFRNALKKYISGTTRARISRSNLEKIKIEIPPLPIQKQIAAILEKADEAKLKRNEANKLTDEFLQSVFIEMFGDPFLNTKNWEAKLIGDLCLVTKLAGFEYTKYIKYEDEGEIIVIRGLNVKNCKLKLDQVKYIDRKTSEFLKRSKLFKDDIVMTYIGINIGDVAIVEESNKYHLAPNVAKITTKNSKIIHPVYLLRFLDMDFNKKQFRKFTTNTAKQALNMASIRKLEIPVPPLSLQQQFAEIVNKTEALKEKQKQSEQELENLFQSLMQKAFKGELVL